jgi:hypothetical protein
MAEDVLTPQPASEFVFRSGLIFGAILGAAQVLGVIIQWLTAMYTQADLAPPEATPSNVVSVLIVRGSVTLLLDVAFFLAMLALTFVAGVSTARKTGKVGLGVFAGLLAGVLGSLVGSLASLVAHLTLLAPYAYASTDGGANQGQAQGLLVSGATFWLIAGLLVYGALGAGMGAIGGLVGQNSYQRAHPLAYQPPFFPYAPWPYPMAPYFSPQSPAPYPGQADNPAAPAPPQEPPQ